MSDYGSPGAAQQRQPEDRLDGIQKLTGSVTFTATGVTVNVSIPRDQGSLTGTSNIEFGGESGSTVGSDVVFQPAVVNTAANSLSASGLAVATAGQPYTVKMTYLLNGKTGTALSGSVSSPVDGPITLQ